jgi:hypothetical protein
MSRKIWLTMPLAVILLGSALFTAEAQARSRRYYRSFGGPLIARPQYPRSMRTSGLKQLGPVPAMGGVRSLPFWGGER